MLGIVTSVPGRSKGHLIAKLNMAQKRMFDRAIIDTDRFMDLSMSAKAIYFLLGMEADDEGFVSYKKVMRIHGGNEDDIKILRVKNFIIAFESGVVVITDWNKNNWLDSRRSRPTEYQTEKKLISLTKDNTYVLSTSLASIEEKRIEEKREEDTSLKFLDELSKEVTSEFIVKFKCEEGEVRTKATSLADYCRSHGKRYKNYKAFLANALRRDFGERSIEKVKVPIYDTSSGKAVLIGFK